MTGILGLGLTHYPLLSVPDNHMADLLRWTLRDPGIPASEKDPANWPERMRGEWGGDGGTAAAAAHRAELRAHLASCRAALDEATSATRLPVPLIALATAAPTAKQRAGDGPDGSSCSS